MVGNQGNNVPEDVVASDRDIQPLSSAGSRLPSIFLIIAAIVGISVLLLLQLLDMGNQRDAAPLEVFQPPATNIRLPESPPPAVPPPINVEPEIVEEEKRDDSRPRFDPLELERIRQIAILEEQKLELEKERLDAIRAEQERRRRSTMVLVDESNDENFLDINSPSNEPGLDFEETNEVFVDGNERFLRDAGNTAVVRATALQLPDQDTLVTQGTFISGVLETAVNSDLPGMVRAVVDKNVYGRTGRHLVIPRGSRLVGRYRSGISTGQARIFIVWSRVERPDGVVVDLGSPGTDTLGVSGVGGDVDTHFFERFGASTLLSTIGPVFSAIFSRDNQNQDSQDIITGARDGFNRSAEIALENSINIPPTIRIDQGTEISIFVNRDLSFADVGPVLR